MLRKLTALAAAAALGGGAALGVAACGEKRGSVQFQDETGGTGTGTTGTVETEKTTP